MKSKTPAAQDLKTLTNLQCLSVGHNLIAEVALHSLPYTCTLHPKPYT